MNFGIFIELLSTQNVNVARFARNIECDFLGDFQTLWTCGTPPAFFKYRYLKCSNTLEYFKLNLWPIKIPCLLLIGKQPRAAANGLIKFLLCRLLGYACLYILCWKGIMQISTFLLLFLCCSTTDVDKIHFNKVFIKQTLFLRKFRIFSSVTFCKKRPSFQSSNLESLTCHPWKLMFLHEYCRPESFFILIYQSFGKLKAHYESWVVCTI